MARYTIIALLIVLCGVMYYVAENLNVHINSVPNLEISVKEARARQFALVIDVRTPKEREQLGFYPHSLPISMDRIEKEIPVPPTSSILVYANGDERARQAATKLYEIGYHHVRYLPTTYLALLPGSAQ